VLGPELFLIDEIYMGKVILIVRCPRLRYAKANMGFLGHLVESNRQPLQSDWRVAEHVTPDV
jgi:hypothetical protein